MVNVRHLLNDCNSKDSNTLNCSFKRASRPFYKAFLAVALLVALPAMFTSCDDDPWYDDDCWGWNDDYYNNGGYYNNDDDNGSTLLDEADVLSGEWDGTMTYTNGDDGQQSQFYANMTFVRNNSNAIKGTGTEIDYTLDSNNQVANQQTQKFNWYIDESTGDIHIKYLTGNGLAFVMDLNASQHGFHLSKDNNGTGSFYGYMIGTNTKDMIYINLTSVQNTDAKKFLPTRAAATQQHSFGMGAQAPSFNAVKGFDGRR